MGYKKLAALVLALSSNAYALEGKVVDENGDGIAGAQVEIVGRNAEYTTDQNGSFNIPQDEVGELHIAADGFNHKIVHLHTNERDTIVIALSRSILEIVDVIGVPIHASIIESALPVAVVSGEALRDQQAATLGDTLEKQVGIHTSFHANVASTPVIRGLSGPRVRITQNGLDVSDASRVGPDHVVATEASTAEQIEILRGPATLFYGSGAIGGVVNVVDNRVPRDSETEAHWLLSRETVNDQNLASFSGKTGSDTFAVYADAFWRDSDDYEVPVEPDADEEEHDDEEHSSDFKVENSAEESSGFTLGGSYLLDNGYVGLSAGRLDREYGIPGHSHGGHEHGDDEESVFAELEQNRFQLLSELHVDYGWLRAINTRAAYTDYEHAEIEDGEVGTVFENETAEIRVDLLHKEFDHWKGGINLHIKSSDESAAGEEAFTPVSSTETLALALVEEKHFGDVLVQFGARIESVTIDAPNVLLPDIELHGHEDEEGEHDHDHEGEGAGDTRVFAVDHDFTPMSLSVGAVWEFADGYNAGISVSHAERAPSAAELLSFGPHIGTGSYEVGALFELHEDEGEPHFELSASDLELETSSNIDLSFRKFEGDVGIVLNAFFNQVDNYYYQFPTGLFAESGHDHGDDDHAHGDGEAHGDDEEDEHEDELPVFLFTSADAEFYGLEAQGIWRINENWQTTLFTDFVHSELKSGAYLPRTPPMRFGAEVDYQYDRFDFNLSWIHYDDQNKVAALETATEGYDLIDVHVNYALPLRDQDITVFLKIENLTDEEARVHTSFLKDVAPRPGRNFSLGIRGSF